MKALILAAGAGTRLFPYTLSSPKHMLPIANKPLLEYNVEQVASMGMKELGIVVGHRKEQIMGYFGDGKKWGLKITYIEQEKRMGISHAILTAEKFIGNDKFVVILGDNLFMDDLSQQMGEFLSSGAEAGIGVQKVDDGRFFGIVEMRDGKVLEIVEKPEKPASDIASVGLYFFSSPKVFGVIRKQKPSARGEIEIADTLMGLVSSGSHVKPLWIKKRWKDTGRRSELLDANRAILGDMNENRVSKDAVVTGSEIIPPCIIGEGCIISKSRIGPFVSMGNGCRVEGAKISESIICEGTEIRFSEPIKNSIIGRMCKVIKKGNSSISVNIGDHSEIIEDGL
ncbi:NTP transferase domain-containing protein [Candidatus Micrarchaeota archaeon]|nr:NTP transferase domain-containing protein [Candidatus Micrarchaeota archaeon]